VADQAAGVEGSVGGTIQGEGVQFGDAEVCVSRSVVMSMSGRGADGERKSTPRPTTEARQPKWSIVVPVKRLSTAKTRLSLREHPRNVLALAFACDTIAAALACPLVATLVAVTSDLRAARELEQIGALVVPDGPEAGLNAALEYGAQVARQRAPNRGTAALSADLPALRPEALGRALFSASAHRRAFVPDVDGRGTTLLTCLSKVELHPEFGPGSAERHRRSGAYTIEDPGLESLRQDVDTAADLDAAAQLGLGSRTSRLLDGRQSAAS
jgi:2-phospho-L-lactate/phosphoenolpyruvate guanylyltransferase